MKYVGQIISSLKIIIAAICAISLAWLLNLEFAVSAGIVAILSVQPTKKETVSTALARLYAFIAALAISFVCYRFIGFNLRAFFVYLAIFIFLCGYFGWYSAMAMDSVLISHFISLQAFGIAQVKNECLLFAIGIGFGILTNLFLRKNTDKIEVLKEQADEQIKQILHRMSLRIMDLNFEGYNGDCFAKLDKAIVEAELFAIVNYKNQLFFADKKDMLYIKMRKNQKEVLAEIYKLIVELKTIPVTASKVSDFFEKVALEYHKDNDVLSLIKDFDQLEAEMKSQVLPLSREEFEDRAILFMMMKRMKEFLLLKRSFAMGM